MPVRREKVVASVEWMVTACSEWGLKEVQGMSKCELDCNVCSCGRRSRSRGIRKSEIRYDPCAVPSVPSALPCDGASFAENYLPKLAILPL